MWYMYNRIEIYVPDHFKAEEVFPPDMISEDMTIWCYMNPLVTMTMDRLREKYGVAFMNTYGLSKRLQKAYGTHYFRGWRTKNCKVGSLLSQHKMGCAGDMVFASTSAESIRADILAQPYDTAFEFITCIEMEVGWLHFDVRPWDKVNKGILKVLPQ